MTLILLGALTVLILFAVSRSLTRRKAERTAYERWLASEEGQAAPDQSFANYRSGVAAQYSAEQAARQQSEQLRLGAPTPEAKRVADQAQRIREWQQAYELANGAPPPPGAVPVFAMADLSQRTNTLAILALIFGIGGGLLGIIFGHVALGQIAKSGEAGRGLAIAGLMFGYGGIAIVVIFLLVSYNSTSHGML